MKSDIHATVTLKHNVRQELTLQPVQADVLSVRLVNIPQPDRKIVRHAVTINGVPKDQQAAVRTMPLTAPTDPIQAIRVQHVFRALDLTMVRALRALREQVIPEAEHLNVRALLKEKVVLLTRQLKISV